MTARPLPATESLLAIGDLAKTAPQQTVAVLLTISEQLDHLIQMLDRDSRTGEEVSDGMDLD